MINEFEVPSYIQEQLPEIANELTGMQTGNNVYKNMQALIKYTCNKIVEHNYTAVKQCFLLADKLYEKGTGTVKNAVENVYVYSFTNMLNLGKAERASVLAIIPMSLYTLYIHQLHGVGC